MECAERSLPLYEALRDRPATAAFNDVIEAGWAAGTTALYRVVADHLETMLQDARDRSAHGFGLPRHVERSFRRYLDRGVLARGFARVRCASCHYEVLVPFSRKDPRPVPVVRRWSPSC